MSIHTRLTTVLGATSVLSEMLHDASDILSELQQAMNPQDVRHLFVQVADDAHDAWTAAEEGLRHLDQFYPDEKGAPEMNDEPADVTETAKDAASRYPTIIAAMSAFSSALTGLDDIRYKIERETDRAKLLVLFAWANARADQVRDSTIAAMGHVDQLRFDVSGDDHDEPTGDTRTDEKRETG